MTPAAGRPDTRTRAGPVAVALLTLVAAAVAILVSRSWSKVVYVIFAVVIAMLARPRTERPEVIRMALLIAGIAVLGGVGFSMVAGSPLADAVLCTPDPCPWLGPTLLLAGVAALLGAAVAVAGLVRYARRGRTQLLLPAVNVFVVGLFAVLLMQGAGGALVEIGGLAAAIGVLSHVPADPRLLRAAVFAQAADLGMFGFVWQLGQGERNPLGRRTIEALLALGPNDASWEAAVAAGMILILAKLALIGFVILVTPHLGRYRRTVLLVATLAGIVGAAVSVVTRVP